MKVYANAMTNGEPAMTTAQNSTRSTVIRVNTQATEILGGRYRIVRPLGGGGMKSVYLAEDLKLSNRLCAVAVMIDNFANPGDQLAAIDSFQREANMLAALR